MSPTRGRAYVCRVGFFFQKVFRGGETETLRHRRRQRAALHVPVPPAPFPPAPVGKIMPPSDVEPIDREVIHLRKKRTKMERKELPTLARFLQEEHPEQLLSRQFQVIIWTAQ